jgi:two-component system KDP operon response regulator KdpE
VYLAGDEVHVTRLEYKLLHIMAHNAGKVLTTGYLLKEVWGHENEDQKHYVRVLTSGLRKKLEPDPASPRFIHTEAGVGYRFFR